ncbi:hypothetical protein OF83DRAFT_1180215 [Amylostereum chailletii]|nr:hypothetical protein OF83DRAFT_1180215 [Amylostereum chailletii]
MSFSTAARNVKRAVSYSPVHLRLEGLPRTTTPADIKRTLNRVGIDNVSEVTLDYHRFTPSGSAYLTFVRPEYLINAQRKASSLVHFGHHIKAKKTQQPGQPPMRNRGPEGRAQALERKLVTGTGSSGGIKETGRSVIISGLPAKIDVGDIRSFLQGYKFVGGEGEIAKLARYTENAVSSRILVRLHSQSEAYRLVRAIHMTHYHAAVLGSKYRISAAIVY